MKKKHLIPIIVAIIGGLFAIILAFIEPSASKETTIEENNISDSIIEVNQ